MSFVVTATADRTLRLEGELDLATAQEFLDAVAPITAVPGDVRLVVDALTFVDSSGLRAFVDVAIRIADGRLVLVDPTETILRMLELTGLDRASGIRIEWSGEGRYSR